MKTMLRKIAWLCIVAFVMSCFTLGTFAAGENNTNQNAKLNTEEYQFLSCLGMTAGDSMPMYDGKNITRAEFGYILARVAGYKPEYQAMHTFSDIQKDAVYANAIGYLADTGIVNGTGSGLFSPDEEVTYDQAMTMAIGVLGYKEITKLKYGEKTDSIRIMANRIGLLEGIEINDGRASMTTNDAVTFIKTVATTPMAIRSDYGSDSVDIYTEESKTPLSVNHGIYYDEGLVVDNGITSIDGATSVGEGRIIIGNMKFLDISSSLDCTKLIGCYVEYWYSEKPSKLLYATSMADGEAVINVLYDDLEIGSSDYTATNIVRINEKGKKENIKVSINALMIYNGVAYPYFVEEDLKIKSGYMVLTDLDNDKVYDLINVVEYENYIAKYVNKINEIIYAEKATLKLDEYEEVRFMNLNGNFITINDLSDGTPISVMRSKGNQRLTIIDCSANKITGEISKIEESSDGKNIYTINENEYTVSTLMNNKIKAQPGETYTVYRDVDGEIFDMKKLDSEDWMLVYFLGLSKTSAFEPTKMLAVFPDGSSNVLRLKEKIDLNYGNGDNREDAEKLVASELFYDKTKDTYIRQVINVKLDEWGQINAIQVAKDTKDTTYKMDLDNFSYDYYSDNASYKGDSKAIAGGYFISKDTVIYKDPYLDEEYSSSMGYEDIEILTYSDIQNTDRLMQCSVYDIDENMKVKAVVFSGTRATSGGEGYHDSLLLIDKIYKKLDEDGEVVNVIKGTSRGAVVEKKVTNKNVLAYMEKMGLTTGMVCQWQFDNDKVTNLSLLYDLNDEPERKATGTVYEDAYETFNYIYGPLYSVSDVGLVTVMPDDGKGRPVYGTAFHSDTVSIYDRSEKEVLPASLKDLYTNVIPETDGSFTYTDDTPWVFVMRRYSYARDIILVLN